MNQDTKTRIIVADADQRVRSALRILLQEEPGLVVVGESSDLPSLMAQVAELVPDLVLLDWELPGRPAAAILVAQTTIDYRPMIIVFSARPESEEAVLAAGADAFVSKGDPPEALLSAFRRLTQKSGKGVNDQEQKTGD